MEPYIFRDYMGYIVHIQRLFDMFECNLWVYWLVLPVNVMLIQIINSLNICLELLFVDLNEFHSKYLQKD